MKDIEPAKLVAKRCFSVVRISRADLNTRSKRCFTFVHIRAPVTPGQARYDGDDARPPALISKLSDNLEQRFGPVLDDFRRQSDRSKRLSEVSHFIPAAAS
jgi:hypothetical protein